MNPYKIACDSGASDWNGDSINANELDGAMASLEATGYFALAGTTLTGMGTALGSWLQARFAKGAFNEKTRAELLDKRRSAWADYLVNLQVFYDAVRVLGNYSDDEDLDESDVARYKTSWYEVVTGQAIVRVLGPDSVVDASETLRETLVEKANPVDFRIEDGEWSDERYQIFFSASERCVVLIKEFAEKARESLESRR